MFRSFIAGLAFLLILSASFSQVDETSARALGMGGAYSASSLDGNAPIWNPGAMDAFKRMALSLNYSAFHIGLEDDFLQEGGLGYVLHLDRKFRYGSVGISYTQFLSDVYSQGVLTLGYAKRIFGDADGKCLSVGANFVLYRNGFNDANFHNFDANDPLVVNNGTSSMAFSADAGIYYRPMKLFSVGVCAKNLMSPDVSISQSGASKEPMKIRGGLFFNLGVVNPTIEVEYRTEAANDKNLDMHIGLEKNFGESFAMRAGYNRNDVGLGFGYTHWGEKVSWGIDYAVLYPLMTEMAKEYFTTHRIGFNLYVEPPPVPVEDLAVVEGSVNIVPDRLILGQEATISAQVENRGEKLEKKVPVSVYYQDADGNWVLAVPIEKITIKPGEILPLKFKWMPPAKGNYTIYVAVDDNGKKLPAVKGKIEEVDEDNNVGFADASVFRKPEGMISPESKSLAVSKLLLYQEEEPIIPLVFFEKNSSTVDDRFDRMLSIVANRLKNNPDVKIDLHGYYDKSTDDVADPQKLATDRANAVRNKLLSFGAPADRVNVRTTGYDMSESRAGLPEEQVIARDRKMMQNENRRVEINAWFTEGNEFLIKVPFSGTSKEPANTEDLARFISSMRSLLQRNEEVIILVEGYAMEGDREAEELSFKRAANVAKWIKGKLGPEFAERVYVHQAYEKSVPENEVWVFPNPEGVVYRPKEADRVLEDYTIEGSEENLVKIDADVDAGVDSFAVSIVDEKGNTVRLLAAGKGQVPKGISWDWRDEAGMLLDFDEKYFAKLQIWDKMGEQLITTSDTMGIQISKQGKRIESLVIVIFMFNQSQPQSKFLESRIEYVARRLIYRAQKGQYKLIATVAGYTDSIGPEYANIALSRQRAERELGRVRKYMKYLLNLDTDAQLDNWLKEHNVVLKAKGYGERIPYVIRRWNSQLKTAETVEIGENDLPEGRTVNRRVLLEMRAEKLPESE
ncbi:OmpA family protein [bacterium]|nr:OmpA family protein [bacterium]